jgi:type IV secretion system protein TrbI
VGTAPGVNPRAAGPAAGPSPARVRRARRQAAYDAALVAPLVAPVAEAASGVVAARAVDAAEDGAATVRAPATMTPMTPSAWGEPPTHQERFLAAARQGRATTGPQPPGRGTVPSSARRLTVEASPGPHALSAGTMLPAVLVTEINSDLPGDILAQVSRDVYDSESQRRLLVPRGSRLLGRYDHQLAMTQNRLLVAWTRLVFPDGRSVPLPGLQAVDGRGAGGLRDQVDRHGRRAVGTAALLSLIGAGAQLAQPGGGYGLLAGPSAGQATAGAAGTQLAQVATQLLQRDLQAQPTIRIRQGMPFNVFLTTDLVFPAAYTARGAADAPVDAR